MKAAILAAAALVAVPTFAAEPDYLDDRSDPAALIRSLYNAVNRKEYARAYSYFSNPTAPDAETYAEGYADTDHVDLVTGPVFEEGAAGSTYFDLPVAIEATRTDGGTAVFAGCYTMRLANPQIQAEDFTPLHIESAKLKPSNQALDDALPANCGPDAPQPVDMALQDARRIFGTVFAGECSFNPPDPKLAEPESYDIPFSYSYDAASDPKHHARLFRFWCNYGAYNEIDVYLMADDQGQVRPLQFAVPSLDITYQDESTQEKVDQLSVDGFLAQQELVNSNYDPDTKTLTAHDKWRGLGDAFSDATWVFREGRFKLVEYEVDASYDGKENPETVIDYSTGP